jgi:hypothetical protein
MSFINDKTKEINCKIVYYGPAQCGKTTSLRHIYNEIKKDAKGELVSLAEDSDHTLYFDFVPLNLGKINDYTIRIHLYTVPGEVGYNQSRTIISKGVDGVVFLVDSQLERMELNLKSLSALKDILKNEGHVWDEVPCVFQYNKRDMKSAVPVAELRKYINQNGREDFETVATNGTGVFEAFRAITTLVLKDLKKGA